MSCILCGSKNTAPPSWGCRLCQSHAALLAMPCLTDEDRAALRAVEEFERRWREDGYETGDT